MRILLSLFIGLMIAIFAATAYSGELTMVKEIYPEELTAVNGTLFFEGGQYSTSDGSELWKSNGTASGTKI